MTEKQLKEAIVSQAVRIAELEEELKTSNWFRESFWQEIKELRERLEKLERLEELESELANIPMATLESAPETPFADLTVEDLEATND